MTLFGGSVSVDVSGGVASVGTFWVPAGTYTLIVTKNGLSADIEFTVINQNTAATLWTGVLSRQPANGTIAVLNNALISPPTLVLPTATLITAASGNDLTGSPATGTVTAVAFQDTQVFAKNYGIWKNDVMAFTERSDLADVLDTILRPVQTQLARDLNVRSAEAEVVVVIGSDGGASLPARYKDIRAVLLNGYPLRYVGPEVFRNDSYVERNGDRVTANIAPVGIFTIEGEFLRVAPAPEPGTEVRVVYYGEPTTLVNESDAHSHLEEAYDLYLHAGIAGVYDYTIEPRLSAKHQGEYMSRLRSFNAQQLSSRTGVDVGNNPPRPGLIV